MRIIEIDAGIPEDIGGHKSAVLVGYDPVTNYFYPVSVDSAGRIAVDTEITLSGTFIIEEVDIGKWGGVVVGGMPLSETAFNAEDFAQEITLSGLVTTVTDVSHIVATTPVVHRTAVTSVDADPVDASGGVDCTNYKECQFDILISGVGFTDLTAQVIFWNSRQSLWFGGGSRKFTATGQHALVADARGKVVFLKVTEFNGSSFQLDADSRLS